MLVGTCCVNEVILTKIVISGSRLMRNFDQIYHILIDMIFLTILFYGFVSRQSEISGGTFCLMSSWMAFKWISTSSRFRNSSGYVFLNQFYWSEFWSGKWNTWKIWSDFVGEQNEEWREEWFIVHMAVF